MKYKVTLRETLSCDLGQSKGRAYNQDNSDSASLVVLETRDKPSIEKDTLSSSHIYYVLSGEGEFWIKEEVPELNRESGNYDFVIKERIIKVEPTDVVMLPKKRNINMVPPAVR